MPLFRLQTALRFEGLKGFFKKNWPLLSLIVKVLVLLATFGYLGYVLFFSQDFETLLDHVEALKKGRFFLVPVVVMLMAVNWGIEALKWQYLMRVVQPIGLKIAFKAVMSGVTVSALLPNRIAEYLGRIFYIPPAYRIKAIIASIVGSLAQFIVSIVLGGMAFIGYFYYPFETISLDTYIIAFLIILLNALLLVAYFQIHLLTVNLPQKGWLRKVMQYLNLIGYYRMRDLRNVLGLALLRYLVFVSQFYLFLFAFQVPLSIGQAFLVLPVVFLAQTLIPTIALAEIGVRGVTAVHFIGFFGGHAVNILSATYGLWVVNILLPALMGALFMVFSNSRQITAQEA